MKYEKKSKFYTFNKTKSILNLMNNLKIITYLKLLSDSGLPKNKIRFVKTKRILF